MATPEPTRAHDDMVLKMIALRGQGLTCAAIAQRFGVGTGHVSRLTKGVRDADIAESGADEDTVLGCYW